jgi:hypothetical protein
MKKNLLFILFTYIVWCSSLNAQVVYQDISRESIYQLLDELANDKVIEINSVVKPYSRKFIYEQLLLAKKDNSLSKRQMQEVDFFLSDYSIGFSSRLPQSKPDIDLIKKPEVAMSLSPVGIHYHKDDFTFSIRPLWGVKYFTKREQRIFHRWGGLDAFATIGEHWGFYSSLRDNNLSELFIQTDHFNLYQGGVYKVWKNKSGGYGGDFSEARGGVTYSNKWGSIGIVKDYLEWGDNYHGSNILSAKAPSFAQLKIHLKPVSWFEFNYSHASLISQVVDSSRSYFNHYPAGSIYRPVFRPKFMAANMFTLKPFKGLSFSFGNSIVYSDKNFQLAYLIPVMFFKSIDHTINANIDNENSQLFFNLSSRQIKHIHLYASLFVDEFKISRISKDDEHNFWSEKIGVRISNLGLKNYSLTFEFTKTMPIVYQHRVPSLTFASNRFSLGHFLGQNSRDFYFEATAKPVRGLYLKAYYVWSQHGEDYSYILDSNLTRRPFMEKVMWEEKTMAFSARYEVLNNVFVYAEYRLSDIHGDSSSVERHTAGFFRGKNNIVSFGFNMGF